MFCFVNFPFNEVPRVKALCHTRQYSLGGIAFYWVRTRRGEEHKRFVDVCFMRLLGPLKNTMLLVTGPVGVCVCGWVGVVV